MTDSNRAEVSPVIPVSFATSNHQLLQLHYSQLDLSKLSSSDFTFSNYSSFSAVAPTPRPPIPSYFLIYSAVSAILRLWHVATSLKWANQCRKLV